jgi:hypothetical protein
MEYFLHMALFNFVADVFTKMLMRASVNKITGLMHGMVSTGVISMQYVDDTLLFLRKNLTSAINLKWIISSFEKMSGM